MLNTKCNFIKISCRILSVILILIMLVGVFDLSILTADADSADGGFNLTLKWNGKGQDPNKYEYFSDCNESRLVRLKIVYENKEVTSGYKPGEIIISVPGIKDAVRSGSSYFPAAIAADKASSTTKYYDWSYTYSSTADTFTFTNNMTIEPNSTFEGGFEIIWQLPSRETKHDFSKTLQAKLRTAKNDQAISNEISYSQTREKDTYTLSSEVKSITSSLMSAEGLRSIIPEGKTEEDYTWVKYDILGTDTYYARDVQDRERFECLFLEGALIKGAGLTKTGETKEIDGKIYECWTTEKNVRGGDTVFLDGIFVAYPNELYEDQVISLYVDMFGTYYEESSESLLAQTEISVNLKDFSFIDIPGDIYDVFKWSSGVSSLYINSHCNTCASHGAVNSMHVSDSSTEYYSCMSLYLNYSKKHTSYYDLEFVDDIMDIQTKNGELRQLGDDEYHFTKVVIPSAGSVENANGFTIEADKYPVEIYLRRANQEFETEPYETTVITDMTQEIEVPEDTVSVKVLVKNVCESLWTMDIGLYYRFHTDADDIVLDNGSVINYMFFNIYTADGMWLNSNYGRDTYPSDELYNRDIELYGDSFDREKFTLHILEVPNEYRSSTYISETGGNREAYYFSGEINNYFTIAEENSLSKFSTYTILPEGTTLQPLYDDTASLLECLSFSASGYSSDYIKNHAKIEVVENYKDSGRTYIAIHYDFSDSPIKISSTSVSNIPIYYQRDQLADISKTFTLRSMTLIDQAGKWYATSKDNNSAEGELWMDIDGDGDVTENAAYSSDSITVLNPENSNLQFTKAVSTTLTNGYVQPTLNEETSEYIEDEIPYTYKNTEYSYKLRMKTGENLVSNIVFVDTLETGERAEWQGAFSRIDTSYAEDLLGAKPTIYYSENQMDSTEKPDLTSADWTTSKPNNAKSIAVDFGEAMLLSGTVLYIEVYMNSPSDEKGELEYKLTENFAHVYYDKYDPKTEEYMEENDLPSNNVPVAVTPFMGTINLVKIDGVNDERLAGAVFKLYEMEGSEPNTATDPLINENFKTNSDGVASITLPYGVYYVVETKAPIGYVLNSKPQIITLNADEPDITLEAKIVNERKDGQFTLRKVSDRNVDVCLPGAVFSVYTDDGKEVQKNLVTDENGELTVKGIEWGSYYLKETKAPDGYILSDEKISFTVNATNDAQDTATVKNEQIPATVILVKTEILEDGTTKTNVPLDGAAYELYDANDKLIGTYMTDDEGKIYVDDLTFGTYYFKESIAAEGYALNEEKITFTIDGNDLQKDKTVSKTVETADTRLTGSVWLQKKDDAGDYVKKARFALFRKSDDVQIDETGKESDKFFTTSEEGIIEITGLYWGEYYLKETKAPLGYDLDDTKHYFTVSRTTVNNKILINAINNRGKGSVQLTKVDEEDDTITLKGAVYTLYKNDGSIYRDDLVTDENGVITVDGIEWGSYYFLEKVAPTGYGLSDEKVRFSVNYISAHKTQILTAKDSKLKGEIRVTKLISIDDIVFPHGDPTFTFRLDGTDVNGKTYTFHKSVTFNTEYVEDYATANPTEAYVEQSIVFTDLPAGQWTVTELITNRYTLDKVESITENGVVVNDTVVFNINEENVYGEAEFTNEKITQSSTTHSKTAVNIAKANRKLTGIATLWQGEEYITSYTIDRTKLDVYAIYDDGIQVKLADDAYTLDRETFDEEMQGEYTITAMYEEGGRVYTDSFVLNLKLPAPFTWTVIEGEFEEDGVKYAGKATITGYTGTSTVMSIPSMVNGIRTLENYDTGEVSYTDNGKTYMVTATIGDRVNQRPMYGVSKISNVVFPDTLEVIGSYTLFNRSNLIGVLEIPSSVTVISECAFMFCRSLTELIFEKNSNLKTIGNNAFDDCTGLTGTLEIPASVTSIGSYAFWSCSPLTRLIFEENSQLVTIGNYAFALCEGLTGTLEIPASVTAIGDYAFSAYISSKSCFNLSGIRFEENSNLQTIGNYAFAYCSGLTGTIKIPASVTSIGASAFRICSSLTALTFEENSNLHTIGEYAFCGCSKLTEALEIPASVTSIGNSAFFDCYPLAGLTFEKKSKLEIIGDGAFSGCSALTGTLEIPASVITIGDSAFGGSYDVVGLQKLTQLTFQENSKLQTIGDYAFSGCAGLTGTLKIPASVTTIGSYSFYDSRGYGAECVNLTGLEFEENSSLETIGNYAFAYCEGLTGTLEIPASVKTIGERAFYECSSLTSLEFEENSNLKTIGIAAFSNCGLTGVLEIPASVITIGDSAFSSCSSLEKLTFEENANLKTIGRSAFHNCGLTGIREIPASVTSIGYSAFAYCSSLEELTFEENAILKTIETEAFFYCSSLTGTLEIPDSVESIDFSAFYGCSSIEEIAFEENSNLKTIGSAAFFDCSSLTGTLEIPASVTKIGDGAFQDCSSLTGFTFEENSNLNTIGNYAFSNCSGLTGTLEIPASVTSIGSDSFSKCSSLTTLTFEENSNLETIGSYAFMNCSGLTGTLKIPASVTTIDSGAFNNCTSLTELVFQENSKLQIIRGFSGCTGLTGTLEIPASVTTIDDYSFKDCNNLTTLKFAEGSTIQTIGGSAFNSCTALTGEVTIPPTITSIGTNAFANTNINPLRIPSTLTTTETYGLDASRVVYYDP